MIKRFWYWLWGPPCEHDWDKREQHVIWSGDVYRDNPLDPRMDNLKAVPITREYWKVTRFCKKCCKVVRTEE